MPQIHFSKTTRKDTSNSFYFGFETYFERLWEQMNQTHGNQTTTNKK